MSRRLLILTALFVLACGTCNIDQRIPEVDTGTINLPLSSLTGSISDEEYEQTFSASFMGVPDVAFALQGFNIISTAYEQWRISPKNVTRTGMSVEFRRDITCWLFAKVSYIASARADLTVDHTPITFPSIQNHGVSRTVFLNRKVLNFMSCIARVYITGFTKKSGSSFSISSRSQVIKESSLSYSIMVGQDLQIDSAQVNYIIFSPNTANFASYRGAISQTNFNGPKVSDIQQHIHSSPYMFYGLTNSKYGGGQHQGFISNNFEPFYVYTDSLNIMEEFSLFYIVIGLSPVTKCQSCQDKFIFRTQCVSSCPTQSYVFKYNGNNFGCRVCQLANHMVVNPSRTGCICENGYTLINGICSLGGQTHSNSFELYLNQLYDLQGTNVTLITQRLLNLNININTPTTNPVPQSIDSGNSVSPSGSFQQFDNYQQESNSYPGNQSLQMSTPVAQAQYCSSRSNTIWTGIMCTCKVGFYTQDGRCVRYSLDLNSNLLVPSMFMMSTISSSPCQRLHESLNGQICVCDSGYRRVPNGECIQNSICAENGQYKDGRCECFIGYTNIGDRCVRQTNCPSNAYFNGSSCTCRDGFSLQAGQCVLAPPCPLYSVRTNGLCVCFDGYTKIGDQCSRCNTDEIYDQVNGKCISVCGVNGMINQVTGACQCLPGYAKLQGVCSICPFNYIIKGDYCTPCPYGSQQNANTNTCKCKDGFVLSPLGQCNPKCNANYEIYDLQTDSCQCSSGLARTANGQCQICINGVIQPVTQQCILQCGQNKVYRNGQCVCQTGYGYQTDSSCLNCSKIFGGFQFNGYCVFCPNGMQYINSECACPSGLIFENGQCRQKCGDGQIIDSNGNCYSCMTNEIAINGKCECKQGYERSGSFCQIKCGEGQYVLLGQCVSCPFNTVFNTQSNSCVCPENHYKNPNGYCQPNLGTQCPSGSYSSLGVCKPCPFGCLSCNETACIECTSPGYYASQKRCVSFCRDRMIIFPQQCEEINKCGNGIIDAGQICDDDNSLSNDGCSLTCQQQSGYKCLGQPSQCERIQTSSGMTMIGTPLHNHMYLYVTILVDEEFEFSSDQAMKNFIKYEFENPETTPSSAYCRQDQTNLRTWTCANIYAFGVPNSKFSIKYSYNYQGKTGYLDVIIDPIEDFRTRNLN